MRLQQEKKELIQNQNKDYLINLYNVVIINAMTCPVDRTGNKYAPEHM